MGDRWELRQAVMILRDELDNIEPCDDGLSRAILTRAKGLVTSGLETHFRVRPDGGADEDEIAIEALLRDIAGLLEAVFPSDHASAHLLDDIGRLLSTSLAEP
jgi:hypothetical protein